MNANEKNNSFMHELSALSDEDKQLIVDWLQATNKQQVIADLATLIRHRKALMLCLHTYNFSPEQEDEKRLLSERLGAMKYYEATLVNLLKYWGLA